MPRPMDRAIAIALIAALVAIVPPAVAQTQTQPQQEGSQRAPQPRPHGKRVAVDPAKVRVGDGDTVTLDWGAEGRETIRILGIDTPETFNPEHNLPHAQSFGYEARAFALGVFAAATSVEVLRADMLDTYGRTLGYLFVNDMNYSVLVIEARLAEESVSRYGDNGFPEQAAEVLAAAKAAGPMPFESPGQYRRRMREVSRWMQEHGDRR